ncbi:MAG: [Fe-Fe] hydrogenase large subunit C-terminal domain-containing protein, partial [Candidatus Rifleibacteriota bacterium]
MPCTAKKFEARRPEFSRNDRPDVDHVITTLELSQMIKSSGLQFDELAPESLDLPLGFKTGAGVIFGNSGGVSEAVLRFVVEKAGGKTLDNVDFHCVRGEESLREASLEVAGKTLKLAVVHGLKNAGKVAELARQGKCEYDLVEVMACPGGCVAGAGQPECDGNASIKLRTRGLYEADKMLQLHKSQENPYITETYQSLLGEPGSHRAHKLLHTSYQPRRRISDEGIRLMTGSGENPIQVKVCVGTNCFLKGSQEILKSLTAYVEQHDMLENIDVQATFCCEKCQKAPNVMVGNQLIGGADFAKVVKAINAEICKKGN